jgi:uncharacterized protein YcaQ
VDEARRRQADAVLDFVRERGVVHPREVDAHFEHGKATNWFGGSSNASTQLLDGMHYRGLLRIARREGGVRLYAERIPTTAPTDPVGTMDALVDIIVNKYAPLPASTLAQLVTLLKFAVPHWQDARKSALVRAKARLPNASIGGHTWYWPQVRARVRAATF